MKRSLLNKEWKIKTVYTDSSVLIDRVCKHRDLDPKNELKELHSAWKLKDIEKAVIRIQEAIQKKERIMIFGDYDVDGVSGASILFLGLKELGAQVSVRLPHREKDGYGLNTKVLDESNKLEVSILITVDCGISNVKEVAYGNNLGLDIIITDHHAIPRVLPEAYAILNPKQNDCKYPDKEVCGSVVAFKLIDALFEKNDSDLFDISKYIDLAALATVADCMPLKGENRLIVKKGLLQFKQTKHRGLRTLLESYELTNPEKEIKSYHLGFNIAPCINAAGRLEDPLIAFKMMMGDSEKAMELRRINNERQDIVKEALEEAIQQVKRDHMNDPILVFWADNWQPGIVGLLAGRLCERYHKPTICLTRHEEKFVGSCRSIPQINIIKLLQENEDLFLNYGGHAQAAGLSIKEKNLKELRKRLIKNISSFLKKNPIIPSISIDTEIRANEISLENVSALNQLEPFGMGNPKPKLLLKDVQLDFARAVGKDKSHLQLGLLLGNQKIKGISFQMAEYKDQILMWRKVDVICQMNKNTFRGNTSVDLQVIDVRPSK
jgi:single-stranded-DNA-specific exonuclease